MKVRKWVVLLPVALACTAAFLEWRKLAAESELVDEPFAAVSRSFGKGGPVAVARALVQLGSAPEEAASVGKAVERKLGRGWQGPFIVAAAPDGGFRHVTAYRGRKRAIVGRESKGVTLVPVTERLLHAEGSVRESVPASLAAAGVPPDLVPDFMDAFRWSLDVVVDAQEGDTFKAVWTERQASGKAVGWRLEAAAYKGSTGKLAAI
ncbi:MAG: hypothetical protein HY925_09890, partial [Elusimicrobia bacterium]|nr:hypothetical protein [Elusimicrobiota bacterium]